MTEPIDMSVAANSLGPAAGGFNAAINLTIDEASADRVVGTVPVVPTLLQPHGIVHGGVYCSIVETLASVGGSIWFGDRGRIVGVSNHTDFLRAISSGTVRAVATPIHRGRTTQLWLVEVTDDNGKLVARGQVRLANLTADG